MNRGPAAPVDVFAWSRLGSRARARQAGRLLRDPGALLNSLWLSRKAGGAPLDLPVFAGPSARLYRHAESRIELGGHLFLGFTPDDEGRRRRDVVAARRPFVAVGRRGYLLTHGVTSIGNGSQLSVRGRLEIGAGTEVHVDAQILCADAITIGAGVTISWNVLIMDSDEHPMMIDGTYHEASAPITIGDHAWIGARAVVLKGVNIGDGAVVAAQSVVTRNVPRGVVVAGAPATVVHGDMPG